jgi:hypothetical protein
MLTPTKPRVISWFSCGAASAVATILAAIKYGDIEAVYCRVEEEHPDNLRFLDDFTRVTGIPVKVIRDEQHQGSIYNVFTKRGFIKNQFGAPCTMILKKDMRKSYQRPTDTQVFGYTAEEQDCYAHLTRLGLKLPAMYHLGYSNNNCIGCVKGGMGYWNKIRKDFPIQFHKMAKLERFIGHAVNKDDDGPVYLDELAPNRGRFKVDMPADCGFTCEVK